MLAAVAYGAGEGAFARAYVVDLTGSPEGLAVTSASRAFAPVRVASASQGPVVAYSEGRSTAVAGVRDGRLVSSAVVTLRDLRLFDGRITVERLQLRVAVTATRSTVAAGDARSTIEGLCVDGKPVSLDDLPMALPGLGTLTAVRHRSTGDGRRIEQSLTGLRLHLTEDSQELPAGSEVAVGVLAVRADVASARRLLPAPSPSPAAKDRPPAVKASPSAPASGGTRSGGGTDDGPATKAGSYSPGPMAPPGEVPQPEVRLGRAVFPVAGRFWYAHDWHAPRGHGRVHHGCDVFARRGTPLVAVQDGVVSRLLTLELGGVSLRLTNDRGDYFYYAHLQRYAPGLRDGQRVRRGQVIGYVGRTGNARTTPPHVHFEIHPGGGPAIDPWPYLELWRGAVVAPPEEEAVRATREPPAPREARLGVDRSRRARHSETGVAPAAVPTPPVETPLEPGLPLAAATVATAALGAASLRPFAARAGVPAGGIGGQRPESFPRRSQ